MSHNVDDDELVSEMEEAPTFASSRPVPNVQEMVMNDPLQPERYVRSQEDFEKVNHMPQLSSEVPVIDLALLLRGNKEELLKLDIVNHSIQKELLQGIKNAASEFFKLPTEEKNKYAMASNDIHGQAYVVSEEQTVDWLDALLMMWKLSPLDHMIDAQNHPKLYQKVRTIMSLNVDEEDLLTEMEEALTSSPFIPLENVQEVARNSPLQKKESYEDNTNGGFNPLSVSLTFGNSIGAVEGKNWRNLKEPLEMLLLLAEDTLARLEIVNHGVQKELMQKMKDATSEFYNLPIEEKNKYAMASNEIQGYGKGYLVSEKQTLDKSDSLMLHIYPTRYRKLQFWPKTPEGFKEIIEAYAYEIRRIVDDVIELEIQHQGGWVPMTPISNALVVKIRDVIEMWSNGKYKSVEHRAVTKKKRRISYALFFCPQHDVEVEPLDHMIDAQNPKLYQKVRFGDYLRQSVQSKLEGKTHLNVVRIDDSDLRIQDYKEKKV
ncbi:S-norcoclaurine synthase 1 [Glycine max]|nr:S-norcoclaurine synthase 1 [Glycine max]